MIVMGYTTVVHTVSMAPVTTIGTSISYVELPTNCVFTNGAISCSVTTPIAPKTTPSNFLTAAPPSVTTSTILSTPSTYTESTSTKPLTTPPVLSPISPTSSRTKPSNIDTASSASSVTPSETSSPVPASHGTSNQIGLALGISITILALFIISWLIFAWKSKRFPFKQKHHAKGGDDVAMKQIDSDPERASIYPRKLNTWEPERRFAGHLESRTDSMGSFGQYKPPVALDYPGVTTKGMLSKPSEDRRSQWYRQNFPEVAPAARRRSMAVPVEEMPVQLPEEILYGLGIDESDWSVERQRGSPPTLSRQPSEESDVKRGELDRVTGFEYLELEREREEGGKKKKA